VGGSSYNPPRKKAVWKSRGGSAGVLDGILRMNPRTYAIALTAIVCVLFLVLVIYLGREFGGVIDNKPAANVSPVYTESTTSTSIQPLESPKNDDQSQITTLSEQTTSTTLVKQDEPSVLTMIANSANFVLAPKAEGNEEILSSTTAQTTHGNCIDSDGGINTKQAGYVTYKGGVSSDYCEGEIIHEYYCHEGEENVLKIVCGYGCESARCNNEPDTPASSTSA
jgi:hypothetical protein